MSFSEAAENSQLGYGYLNGFLSRSRWSLCRRFMLGRILGYMQRRLRSSNLPERAVSSKFLGTASAPEYLVFCQCFNITAFFLR